jgi:hypothetical protein
MRRVRACIRASAIGDAAGRQPVPFADALRHDFRLFMAYRRADTLAAMKYRERLPQRDTEQD